MFVNSIQSTQAKARQYDTFKGVKNPEVLKNHYRIFLSQDIWNPNLAVKMPDEKSGLEKEILMEVLKHRLILDKLVRLSKQKADIMLGLSIVNGTNSNTEEITNLRKKLLAMGNLDSVINTLDKKIRQEKLRHPDSIAYFQDIANMEEQYLNSKDKNKKISIEQENKFWHQVRKHNINPDGTLCVEDIIDKVNAGIAPKPVKLTKEALLKTIKTQYELTLRQITNFYSDRTSHYQDAIRARLIVEKNNEKELKEFPDIKTSLENVYKSVERTMTTKVDRLVDVKRKENGKIVTGIDVYPIGEYWKIMNAKLEEAKKAKNEIEKLRLKFKENPDSKTLKAKLKEPLKTLAEAKDYWLGVLQFSVEKELENRTIFNSVHRLPEYEYLADENLTIIRNRKLLDIAKANNDSLPEEVWDEILS